MPIYEYYCHNCDYIFEELNKGYTEKTMECPVCGQQAQRLISNTSFILKGTGFYETDYKRKSSTSGNGGNGKDNANGNGGAKAEKATSSENNTQKQESSSSSSSSESGSSSSSKGTSQDKD